MQALQGLIEWCLGPGRHLLGMEAILRGFSEALHREGIHVDRIFFPLKVLHPQANVAGYRLEDGVYKEIRIRDSSGFQAQLSNSPFRSIFAGTPRIRRRLIGLQPDEFPIYAELAAIGYTDYLMLGVDFANGDRNAISFATRMPNGFDEQHLQAMEAFLPALVLLVEREHAKLIATTVTRVYLGAETGPKVLAGRVYRGDVEQREAVVGFCDLREFTSFSESHTVEEVVDRLNRYFEVVGKAVSEEGGEILKLIGDAALVVFDAQAPEAALRAARKMVLEMPEEMNVGVALHCGTVSYGNIGAPDRLDFTVIGAAVNRASRLAGLCAPLGESLLLSGDFVRSCPGDFRCCGSFSVKGVVEPVEVFAPLSP